MASLVRVWISFEESAMPAVHQLDKATMLIGREGSCDIPVIDPSVSRNHASISIENSQYVLRDHGSSNGTYVNGEPIRAHALQHGDTIRFGEIVYLFQETEVTPEKAAELSQQAALDLDLTSAQPVQQVPVAPQQNNPVSVLISNSQKIPPTNPSEAHYTSRTIPISVPKGKGAIDHDKKKIDKNKKSDDAFISYVCGCAGVLGILPALYFGHRTDPMTPEDEKYQTRGLTFGYLFLFIWLFSSLFLWINRAQIFASASELVAQGPLVAPEVKNGLAFLQGSYIWAPPRKHIQTITEKVPTTPAEIKGFKRIYGELVSQWEKGLIVYQPDVIRVIPALSAKDHLKFVTEDFLTKPTFLEYNSTVVPEKKDPIGSFLVPSLSSWMFFARDQNLRAEVEHFNDEAFPWRNGYRGLAWKADSFDFNASQIPNMRLLCVMKAALKPYMIQIKTREGTLNSDYSQIYKLSYCPAEYLALIVYIDKTNEAIAVHANPTAFANDLERKKAQSLLRANLPKIIALKPPEDETGIPDAFYLDSLSEALRKFPVE